MKPLNVRQSNTWARPRSPRTLWNLAELFKHRLAQFPGRKCPRCGGISLCHQYKILGRWACRNCADKEAAKIMDGYGPGA